MAYTVKLRYKTYNTCVSFVPVTETPVEISAISRTKFDSNK